jgi:hypothetical protein
VERHADYGTLQPLVHQYDFLTDTGYEAVPSPTFRAAADALLEADRALDRLLQGDPAELDALACGLRSCP